jgi:hypothetical protein
MSIEVSPIPMKAAMHLAGFFGFSGSSPEKLEKSPRLPVR